MLEDLGHNYGSDATVVQLADGKMTAQMWVLVEVGPPEGDALEHSGFSEGSRLAGCIETDNGTVSYDFYTLRNEYPVLGNCDEIGNFLSAWLRGDIRPESVPEGAKLYPEDMQAITNE